MRIRSLALLVAAASLTLAGCATGGTGTQKPAPSLSSSAELSGSITVWSWDVAAESLKKLAPQFEAEHPGTTVKVVDVGYDNAYDKISVGLQGGSGLPDLVTIESDHMPGYISAFPDAFVDLIPLVGAQQADFDPSKWAASSDAGGNLLSLPWDSGTVALYYRADYLQQAGIDPTSLATWDDVVAAGKTIKAKTGHTLMSIDVSSGATFLMMCQQQGGAGIFDDAGDITINSPEAVRALTLLQQMDEAGLINNVKGWDGRVSATKAGKSAVHPEAVWWVGTLTSEMPELKGKFGVVPLPVFSDGDAHTANNGGSTLAVPAQSTNPDLAAAFAAWALASTDNQVAMMKQAGLFPSYLPALKDPYFTAPQPYFVDQQPVYQLFGDLTGSIPAISYTSDYAKALDIVSSAVVGSVLNGKDPQAALDGAADQIATATGRTVAAG